MDEAFDNPWKQNTSPRYAHYGWWKLKENKEPSSVNNYVEKVLAINSTNSADDKLAHQTGSNVWYYAVGIAAFVAWMLLILLIIQQAKLHKLRNILTQEEVKQFIEGVTGKKPASEPNKSDRITDLMSGEAMSKPYDKTIEISKDSCQIYWSTLLGFGEFGFVYKAVIDEPRHGNRLEVALKMAKDPCPKTALISLLTEIKILTYLGKHPNLVSIIGAYTTEISNGVVYVATELCQLGSLKTFLRDAEKVVSADHRYYGAAESLAEVPSSVTFIEMVRWSHEIACGMEYLAKKQVVHADLATRNVLLTVEKTAKITDFGLSRRLYDYTNYVKKQQEPLPWRWMAIESLNNLEFSSQSDVWSYGVTLWEIFSMGHVPYPGLSWTLDFVSSLEAGLRMKSPIHATKEIFELMKLCWEREPQSRPKFLEIKETFGQILETQSKEYDYISNV